MKSKNLGILLSIFVVLILAGTAAAQFEDDELLIEEETISCTPESLTTSYDKYYNAETPIIDIKQWYSFGSEYYKNKSYKAALPYLWKVFVNDSTKYARLAIGKIAKMYFELGVADSILISCYRGLAKYPDQTTLHYYAGYIQDKLGRFQCAIPHYEALVESDPENKVYLEKLSFFYFKDNNEKAIEIQNRLVTLDPSNAEYQNKLALFSEHFYGPGGGLEAFKNAWLNDKQNPDFAYKYGKAAYDAGKYKEALEPLSALLKADPKHTKGMRITALSYESLGDYTSAINNYKKILDIEPDNAEIMCDIANSYRNQNNFTNAAFWINKALRAKPGYGLAYITMGEVYESAVSHCQQGRDRKYDDGLVYEKAQHEYEKALNDAAYRSTARKRINNLKPYLPTAEEIFMNQNRKNLKLSCYSWIK